MFKVGDRVRWPGDGEEGTIVSLVSHFGEDSAEIEWDVAGPALHYIGSFELVEEVEAMPEFKPGDRVRHVDDGDGSIGDGEVVRIGRSRITVDWFNDSLDRKIPREDLELVEEQPNRTYYGNPTMEELNSETGPKVTWPHQDAVDPDHYKFPGGAEVIHISQWLTANSSQALQYIARSSRIDGKNKGDASEDIRKAITFLEFELKRLEDK